MDKGKKATARADKVLFINAHQLDRAHCDFTEAQIEFISNIVRFHRNEDFKEKLEALNEELGVLNNEACKLETRIAENVEEL